VTSEQLELGTKGKPEVSADDPRIEKLVSYLAGKGWVMRGIAFAVIEVENRIGRQLKALSGGRIISSYRGYKLTVDATPKEKQDYVRERRACAESEVDYVDQVERVWNQAEREREAVTARSDSN